ncbi:MAG TPA: universal stress protein [Xanthobacteraceae bacterium]|jgi:nucleotide-binding universal stress UspA family protein
MAIRSILHPTDFSELSGVAFAHALRIALAGRSKLHLLHVEPHEIAGAQAFPHVRKLLMQWGLAEEDDPPWVVASRLGIEVDTTLLKGQEPAPGIVGFLRDSPSHLIVLATRGRDGLEQWLNGSVSEIVARHSAAPTLFIAPGARGFVSPVTGDLKLRRALIPIDFSPRADKAINTVALMGRLLTGAEIVLHFLHVGRTAPSLAAAASSSPAPEAMLRSGNVVSTIIDVAIEFDVDFIGMPTAGHRNILDIFRGSTTERVIRHAPCPVIAVPAA